MKPINTNYKRTKTANGETVINDSICSERCEGCYYGGKTSLFNMTRICQYCVIARKSRPCPAGDNCTEYKPGYVTSNGRFRVEGVKGD